MSTEHQRYSTENQADAIARYAEIRGFEIIKTYEDSGKSGLRIEGRKALQQLISDVKSGTQLYCAILVFDVSRWGRFQDADESAYYEFICREARIKVHYCNEQFENDGSLSSTIIKSMKRAMAGEYSRELSSKVHAGQSRLSGLGFRQGGPAGFGLRRQLLDEQKNPKALLKRGEHKSLQTDRVILVPGPRDEIELVKRLYRMFVVQRRNESEIAELLNSEGSKTDFNREWTRATVHQVLTNEKYVGRNVFNRRSFRLKLRRVKNPPSEWVRNDAAFQPIVDVDFFEAAQKIIQERSRRYSNQDLLDLLENLYSKKGWLSGLVIDEQDEMPSSSVFRNRFGSLVRAYGLIGYSPARDYSYIEINRFLRELHREIVDSIINNISENGSKISKQEHSDNFLVNDEFSISIVIARCNILVSGSFRWKIRMDTGLRPKITIAARMDEENKTILDYYILPRVEFGFLDKIKLAPENPISLDAYRFDTLHSFIDLTRRTQLGAVA